MSKDKINNMESAYEVMTTESDSSDSSEGAFSRPKNQRASDLSLQSVTEQGNLKNTSLVDRNKKRKYSYEPASSCSSLDNSEEAFFRAKKRRISPLNAEEQAYNTEGSDQRPDLNIAGGLEELTAPLESSFSSDTLDSNEEKVHQLLPEIIVISDSSGGLEELTAPLESSFSSDTLDSNEEKVHQLLPEIIVISDSSGGLEELTAPLESSFSSDTLDSNEEKVHQLLPEIIVISDSSDEGDAEGAINSTKISIEVNISLQTQESTLVLDQNTDETEKSDSLLDACPPVPGPLLGASTSYNSASSSQTGGDSPKYTLEERGVLEEYLEFQYEYQYNGMSSSDEDLLNTIFADVSVSEVLDPFSDQIANQNMNGLSSIETNGSQVSKSHSHLGESNGESSSTTLPWTYKDPDTVPLSRRPSLEDVKSDTYSLSSISSISSLSSLSSFTSSEDDTQSKMDENIDLKVEKSTTFESN